VYKQRGNVYYLVAKEEVLREAEKKMVRITERV
jgi:hypothetical protein